MCHKSNAKWAYSSSKPSRSISTLKMRWLGSFWGYFLTFLATETCFKWLQIQFLLHFPNVKSGSHWKIMKLQWEPALTFCSLLLSAMKTCFSKSFTKCQNRLSLLLKSMKTWIDVQWLTPSAMRTCLPQKPVLCFEAFYWKRWEPAF